MEQTDSDFTSNVIKARRIYLWKTRKLGKWYYRVLGYNWKTIDDSHQGFSKRWALKRIRERYPNTEIIYRNPNDS